MPVAGFCDAGDYNQFLYIINNVKKAHSTTQLVLNCFVLHRFDSRDTYATKELCLIYKAAIQCTWKYRRVLQIPEINFRTVSTVALSGRKLRSGMDTTPGRSPVFYDSPCSCGSGCVGIAVLRVSTSVSESIMRAKHQGVDK
ncbi:hypothetical protein J6590_016732 [Homalodisca vitripennis]|nr:hypothetical protein J6590_016732 [Homalodisca vitripennis]